MELFELNYIFPQLIKKIVSLFKIKKFSFLLLKCLLEPYLSTFTQVHGTNPNFLLAHEPFSIFTQVSTLLLSKYRMRIPSKFVGRSWERTSSVLLIGTLLQQREEEKKEREERPKEKERKAFPAPPRVLT